MSKIEDVARAIDPEAWDVMEKYARRKGYAPDDFATLLAENTRVGKSLADARAAIAAMREPTEGMVKIPRAYDWITPGHVYDEYDSDPADLADHALGEIWAAMIDADLEGKG